MKSYRIIKLIWFTIFINQFFVPSYATELSDLGGAFGMGTGGQPIETTATFAGGFSVDAGDFLSGGSVEPTKLVHIMGQIKLDPNHIGQVADIVVYAHFASLDDPTNSTLLMIGENNTVLPWNFQPADLIAFIPQITLPATQEIDIYNDFLPEGHLQIFFGYLLADALIVNQQPIDIILETIPEPVEEPIETEENVPIDTTPLLISDEDRLVGQLASRWPNGSTLKVGFDFNEANFNYLPAVCQYHMSRSSCENAVANEVIRLASRWSQYGNIYFQRSTWDDADIRVRFREVGSWSYVGTSAKHVPTDQETMNLALSFLRQSDGFSGTVIHEFGHAIGLHHEHVSPEVAYDWNEAQIIADMQQQGWSAEQTRLNIIDNLLKGHSRSAFFTTTFDPKSIMIYTIPKSWVSAANAANPTLCPDADKTLFYCVGNNTELSELDKQGIARFYPKRSTQGGNQGCSYTYDPSAYRPGTSEWNGHMGWLAFHNSTDSTARVMLYHPAQPRWVFGIWDIPARQNWWLYYYYSPLTIGMDWGIKVNNSPVCIIKTVTTWRNNSYFQASTSRLPGL